MSNDNIPPQTSPAPSRLLSQEIGEIRERSKSPNIFDALTPPYRDIERLLAIVEELQRENEAMQRVLDKNHLSPKL